jgi:prepilin-type N-terminal cleavage/methylation domain-containing protein
MRTGNRGFTLVELLVVVMIIALVAALGAGPIYHAFRDRAAVDAASIVHGQLATASARAVAAPAGVFGYRLVPDPAWPLERLADGTIDRDRPLAFSRMVPLSIPADYSEGRVTIHANPSDFPADFADWLLPGRLVLEEAIKNEDGKRSSPTSWYWNLKVGEVLQIAGRSFTICGPMVVGPGDGNAEMFVNVGTPGTVSPLVRTVPPLGTHAIEFLYLANRTDDDGDGYIDEGWDGIDNDLVSWPDVGLLTDDQAEWEAEAWNLPANLDLDAMPYVVKRRPAPGSTADAVELPSGAVIDATAWTSNGMDADGNDLRKRSQVSPNLYTGAVDLMFDRGGRISVPTIYGRSGAWSIGRGWLHLWIASRDQVLAPPSAAPAQARLVSADVFTGRAVVVEADGSDPTAAFRRAEGGDR